MAYIVPISASIILLLTILYFSYRQTVQAYPGGGRFVGSLLVAIVLGVLKTVASGGHPVPVAPLPRLPLVGVPPGLWRLLLAFASGCTATGCEASL